MPRILYAEDDPGVRELTTTLLKSWGHEVEAAEDGKKAFALFEVDKFDLVITDKDMPNMSGRELMRAIRQAEEDAGIKSRGIPVVLTTGRPDQDEGFDVILPKPFRNIFLQAIASAVAE